MESGLSYVCHFACRSYRKMFYLKIKLPSSRQDCLPVLNQNQFQIHENRRFYLEHFGFLNSNYLFLKARFRITTVLSALGVTQYTICSCTYWQKPVSSYLTCMPTSHSARMIQCPGINCSLSLSVFIFLKTTSVTFPVHKHQVQSHVCL